MEESNVTALVKSRKPYKLVQTEEDLASAIRELRNHAGRFGIDAERASGFRYSQRAYLIQINRRDSDIYLIDPASISQKLDATKFTELAELLRDDQIGACWRCGRSDGCVCTCRQIRRDVACCQIGEHNATR